MFLASHGINASYQTSGDGSLADVLASAVFDLDATQSASYPGTGTTWANLVTAPADGSAQTDYDFFTGDGVTSTTYPTFNGTAGDPAAYWTVDGGDYFRLKSGVNPAFIAAMHKTTGGSDWTVVTTLRAVAGTTTQGIFATNLANNFPGVRLQIGATELTVTAQRGDTANVNANPGVALSDATNYLVIVSHSHSTNITRFWINTGTAVEVAQTYNTTTTDANQALVIGATSATPTSALNNTTRMYSFGFLNEYLDNTKAAAIIAALEARHGRDYTP